MRHKPVHKTERPVATSLKFVFSSQCPFYCAAITRGEKC
ncbi:hypothetical protein YPPY88_4577, partial [Yersinia pestis PY-88]